MVRATFSLGYLVNKLICKGFYSIRKECECSLDERLLGFLAKPRIPDDELLHGQETEQEVDNELMSSCVIEITPDRKEGTDI